MNKYKIKQVPLTGLHAYCKRSFIRGESIQFRCSSKTPYDINLYHLKNEIDELEKCQLIHTIKNLEPITQDITPGSFLTVDEGIPAELINQEITFQVWIKSWETLHKQCIFHQYDANTQTGIKIELNQNKNISLCINGKTIHTDLYLTKHKWEFLNVTINQKTASVFLDTHKKTEVKLQENIILPKQTLLIGAGISSGVICEFLDADIAQPAIYNHAFSQNAITKTFHNKALTDLETDGLIVGFLLNEEKGSILNSVGNVSTKAKINNHATWMIGGPAFVSKNVPRYESYSPSHDNMRGHGLRLCSDDLYDCKWAITDSIQLPQNAPCGLYLARFHYTHDTKKFDYDLLFCLRNQESENKLLVLTAQNTWTAYNTVPFPLPNNSKQYDIKGNNRSNPGAPNFSCYQDHIAGQPAFYFGKNIPFPAASPSILFSDENLNYSQGLRMERFFHTWLDALNISYDILPDTDLDEIDINLSHYDCIAIVGHSEYWSSIALNKMQMFLNRGGNLLILSGNTTFWRVSNDSEENVMECRKWEYDSDIRKNTSGCIAEGQPIGTLYHSHDQKRGGLLRETETPGWLITGAESATWWVDYKQNKFGVFKVLDDAHPMLHHPYETNLLKNESFGQNPDAALPKIIGHETDLSIQTLITFTKSQINSNFPSVLPEIPKGFEIIANGYYYNDKEIPNNFIDFFGRNNLQNNIISEIFLWKRPQGGQIFNVGSVAAAWPLHVDKKYARLILNALDYFGIKKHRK